MVTGWLQSRRLDAWMRGVDHYATLLVLLTIGVYSLTPFSTSVLATAMATATSTTRDRGPAGGPLLFVALLAFAALLLYARWSGLLRADVQPTALRLYLRTAVFVAPVVPVLAFAVRTRRAVGRAGPPGRAQPAGLAAAGVAPAARRRRARAAASQQPAPRPEPR